MSHSVRSHLSLEIDAYDDTIRKFIPGYAEGLTRAAKEIAGARPTLVIDLGAGTGALAEAMLEHERVGSVEAIDIDPEMLAQARIRLKRFGTPRVSAGVRSMLPSPNVTPWPLPWPCTTFSPWNANSLYMNAFTERSASAVYS